MPGTDLLEALKSCGSKLPESHKPSPVDVYDVFAGLLYWLETGSTIAPEPAPEATPTTEQDILVARLEAELASAEANKQISSLPASPVAPVPPQSADSAPAPSAVGQSAPSVPPQIPPSEPTTPPASDIPSAPAG